MKLVIVESPSKAHTIEKYLGEDYTVMSSVGHIRDLSTKGKYGLGIDVENGFTPDYITIKGKEKLVKDLQKESKKAEVVYLATDPDREGEAISYHLKEVLDNGKIDFKRVEFHEITKNAVIHGIENPRDIDYPLVNSQETRRKIDRIIGFRLSSLLWRKIKSRSAGRVQSVALLLICDLEKEIKAFIPSEYHEIYLNANGLAFKLEKYNNKNIKIETEDEANKIINALDKDFYITSIETKETESKASLAFTTSTLTQQASTKLGFSAKKTMMLAQKLYEGINIGSETTGLITYMRTDSTRLADEFLKASKDFIIKSYGKEYYKHYTSKISKNAQDAHEAIRPTNVLHTPSEMKNYLSRDEYKLYNLIYTKTLACQMANAKYLQTTYNVLNNDYLFKVNGRVLTFDGYLKVYKELDEEENNVLPLFKEGDKLNFEGLEDRKLFTKPKPRYTEARLIKKLEELGIGRPSTYATIIDTLKTRKYVEIQDKKFVPTEQGMLTNDKLEEFFSTIVNVEYTAKMEQALDEIATGEEDSLKVLTDFYDVFSKLIDNASEKMEKQEAKETGMFCPECGSPLVERIGRYGKFIACQNYPTCKYIYKEKKEVELTGVTCPKCGKGELVKRLATRGKNKGNYFYACNCFPKCDYVTNSLDPLDEVKETVKKKSTTKKTSTKKTTTKAKTTK